MSYYHIDGVSGVFASSETAVHEQSKSWRLGLASLVLVVCVVTSSIAIKVYAGIEQAEIALPRIAASTPQPQSPVMAPAILADSVDSKLQEELTAWAETKKTDTAFYVQSLDNGSVLADINATKQYQMASIYKLFLLQPLANKLPAEAWVNTKITDKSYEACVHAMLAVSDNPCAEAIADKLNWTTAQKQIQGAGYKSTVINNTEKFHSTAADTALLLDRLYHGDGYDAKTKGIALQALAKRKGAEAIRKSCTDCTVYNKTGDLKGFRHDAAIVEKNGKAYVVVIFSSGSSWSQLAETSAIINMHL